MEEIVKYFVRPESGIMGIIILMFIAVIIWQQKRIDKKEQEVGDLQEKRKVDTDAYTKSYTELAREQVATARDNVNTINLLQRSVDALANALQALTNSK